jgi:hypothetical protein
MEKGGYKNSFLARWSLGMVERIYISLWAEPSTVIFYRIYTLTRIPPAPSKKLPGVNIPISLEAKRGRGTETKPTSTQTASPAGLQLCLLSTKLPVDGRVSLVPALCGLVGLLLTCALVCRYRDEIPFGCFGGTTRDRYLYGIYMSDPHRLRASWQRCNDGVVGKVLDVTTALPPSGLLALQEMEPPEVLTAHIRYQRSWTITASCTRDC